MGLWASLLVRICVLPVLALVAPARPMSLTGPGDDQGSQESVREPCAGSAVPCQYTSEAVKTEASSSRIEMPKLENFSLDVKVNDRSYSFFRTFLLKSFSN